MSVKKLGIAVAAILLSAGVAGGSSAADILDQVLPLDTAGLGSVQTGLGQSDGAAQIPDGDAMFQDVNTIKNKTDFVVSNSRALRRDMDFTQAENKAPIAKNIFLFGQCMEGTQFYGLFGMILALYRQNKFPGIGQMFSYTLRDESHHIELLRNLLMDLVEENPEI